MEVRCDCAGVSQGNYSCLASGHVPACVAESGDQFCMLLQLFHTFFRVTQVRAVAHFNHVHFVRTALVSRAGRVGVLSRAVHADGGDDQEVWAEF